MGDDHQFKLKLQSMLIILGLLIIIAAVIYALIHNDQPYNPNPKACVNQTLSFKQRGSCIKDAQDLLNWYLYEDNRANYLKVNGQFDEATKQAVIKTQQQASLSVNGKIDFETWKLLCSSITGPAWWLAAAKNAGCQL